MLVCSQLVENVHGQDAKLFQATQVVDEGRHNEVLHRYLALRLDGESYPLAGNVLEIFDTLLGTSAWYLKTIGLQLVAETFAVSLFRMLAESSKDEVLRTICRRILQDEARHMGFSMLSLPAVVEEATESERREMEDFAVWALNRTLRGVFPLAVYQDMGFDRSDIEEIRQLRRERAAGGDETAFRKFFRRDLHAGLVRNMRKVGVLTNRVAPDLEALVGLPQGHIFHGELSADQLFWQRPAAHWADYRTPIAGLYLCGSSAHPGGGVSGIPGHNAAREIRRDWRRLRLRRSV